MTKSSPDLQAATSMLKLAILSMRRVHKSGTPSLQLPSSVNLAVMRMGNAFSFSKK